MMDFIAVPAVVGIITYGIYSLFELFARRKERLALIEKLGTGNIQGDIKLGKIEFSSKFSTLKWACLLMGIGLGLMIGYLIGHGTIPFSGDVNWRYERLLGVIYGASVLLCGGLGMLVAFLVEFNLSKKNEK